ncbi:SCO family protein [Kaistia dalseonensis]|uniref:Protein SCO1/2 n=1 Tax=Kaistia dalseonensis TaxID=410840 RepID=A0ABU0H984_9HYPH|nr:SCO family protein [Kaistia dalseonensis]MCX5495468.1 SCO family protein [Kaistia dalseonensis]MDQ0438059.1 protein SCO1/2 [Kaistia dalseonensis]
MAGRTRLLLVLTAAIVTVGIAAAVGYRAFETEKAPAGSTVASLGIGGPINLVAASGARFTSADLEGKPHAIFFGFTHCPNVCPTTLSDLTLDLDDLGPLADRLKVLFVSVDPERDTPQIMKDYLSAFDPRIIGLTGTPTEIAAIAKDYHVFYEKVPTADGDYTMNHTAGVYLMNAKGEFTGTISFEEERDVQIAKLKRLANG